MRQLKTWISTVGLLAVMGLALAVPASATVTFDSTSGEGFVGKGDVMNAFGWKSQAFDLFASGVTFKYIEQQEYSWTCTSTSPSTATFEGTTPGEIVYTNVSTSVARSNRNDKITGFNLTGFTEGKYSREPVKVEDPCSWTPTGQRGKPITYSGTITKVTSAVKDAHLDANVGSESATVWRLY